MDLANTVVISVYGGIADVVHKPTGVRVIILDQDQAEDPDCDTGGVNEYETGDTVEIDPDTLRKLECAMATDPERVGPPCDTCPRRETDCHATCPDEPEYDEMGDREMDRRETVRITQPDPPAYPLRSEEFDREPK